MYIYNIYIYTHNIQNCTRDDAPHVYVHTTASVRRWLHTENIHLRGLSISMVAYAAGSIRNPTSWLKSIYVFINLLKYSGGLWVVESCTICGWFSSICPATMFMATMVLSSASMGVVNPLLIRLDSAIHKFDLSWDTWELHLTTPQAARIKSVWLSPIHGI